jgi:hypothetical protein
MDFSGSAGMVPAGMDPAGIGAGASVPNRINPSKMRLTGG